MSFDQLAGNLVEIASALRDPSSPSIPLVANWKATHLYDARVGWGRMWRWIYSIAALFTGSHHQEVKVNQAVLTTHQLFQEQLPRLEELFSRYKDYLHCICEEYPMTNKEIGQTKRELSRWFIRITPYCLPPYSTSTKINTFFHNTLGGKELFSSSQEQLLKNIGSIQSLIELEELHRPLPFAALMRVATERKLSSDQSRSLQRWSCRIDEKGKRYSSGKLHQALRTLLEERLPQKIADEALPYLEWKLVNLGCQLLTKDDPEQLFWRSQILLGDQIICKGKSYVVGDLLDSTQQDRSLHFAIQGDATKSIVIGNNPAIMGIEQCQQQVEGWGVPCPEIQEVDPSGKVSIQERLEDRVGSYYWKSEYGILSSAEEMKAKPLIKLLMWLKGEASTPVPFRPDLIRWDQQGNLKAVQPLTKGVYDFHALEQFALGAANGNRFIYRHLMQESGLISHPIHRFYQQLLQKALMGEMADAGQLAASSKIGDRQIIERAIELRAELLRAKQRCIDKLEAIYLVPRGREKVGQLVADQLVSRVEEGEIDLMHDERVIEECVDAVTRFKRFKMKEELFQKRKRDLEKGSDEISLEQCYRRGIYHPSQIKEMLNGAVVVEGVPSLRAPLPWRQISISRTPPFRRG